MPPARHSAATLLQKAPRATRRSSRSRSGGARGCPVMDLVRTGRRPSTRRSSCASRSRWSRRSGRRAGARRPSARRRATGPDPSVRRIARVVQTGADGEPLFVEDAPAASRNWVDGAAVPCDARCRARALPVGKADRRALCRAAARSRSSSRQGAERAPGSGRDRSRRTAACALRANLEARDASRAKVVVAGAGAGAVPPCDVVVLDPPEDGSERRRRPPLRDCQRPKPGQAVYVACDPVTLGRDGASARAERAMWFAAIETVELFPQTGHVGDDRRLSIDVRRERTAANSVRNTASTEALLVQAQRFRLPSSGLRRLRAHFRGLCCNGLDCSFGFPNASHVRDSVLRSSRRTIVFCKAFELVLRCLEGSHAASPPPSARQIAPSVEGLALAARRPRPASACSGRAPTRCALLHALAIVGREATRRFRCSWPTASTTAARADARDRAQPHRSSVAATLSGSFYPVGRHRRAGREPPGAGSRRSPRPAPRSRGDHRRCVGRSRPATPPMIGPGRWSCVSSADGPRACSAGSPGRCRRAQGLLVRPLIRRVEPMCSSTSSGIDVAFATDPSER